MSSGAEVAKETTVIPIIIFGIFKPKEIDIADFNSQFPPKINKIKPISIKKKLMFYFLNEDTFLYVSYLKKDGFDQKTGFSRCFLKKLTQKAFILLHNIILNSKIHLIYKLICSKAYYIYKLNYTIY